MRMTFESRTFAGDFGGALTLLPGVAATLTGSPRARGDLALGAAEEGRACERATRSLRGEANARADSGLERDCC